MTIREVSEIYGTSKMKTSYGDNLWLLCFRLYGSDDPKYRRVLTELNIRYDWDDIQPGSEIVYITSNNIGYASELDV